MEAHDDGEMVRPVPLDNDDTHAPSNAIRFRGTKTQVRGRPWLPMLLAGGSIVLLLGVVSVLGALEFETPPNVEPRSFSSQPGSVASGAAAPPLTLPPALEESLPGLTDRLTLITLTEKGFVTLLWDPSFRIPREYPLSVPTIDPASSVFVRFDSAGRTLAIGRRSPSGYLVYLGDPTNLGPEPGLISDSRIAWHATKIGALAWVAVRDDGKLELRTGSVNPLTGDLMDETLITTLEAPTRVVRWDSAGFILDDGREIHSLDPAGRTLWSREGSMPSVTPSLVVAAVPNEASDTTRWEVIDRASGDPVELDVAGSPDSATIVTSRELDIVAAISGNDTRSTLTVGGPDLVAKRIVQVDADVTPIGFTTGNAYMIFEATGTNDLIFVNWRTGATQSLDIPDIYEVLALDLS